MAQAWLTTSWDDGHPLDLRIADLLATNGLTGTFYIPRQAPTGVMSETQIRQLALSFEIGGHTLDHLFLPDIPDNRADLQISGCKKWVQDLTGSACDVFCPPAGRFTVGHLSMIHRAGFRGLRSVELLSTRRPKTDGDLLHMPTTLQAYPHRRSTYFKNTIKRRGWSNLWRYIWLGASSGWESLAEKLLETVLNQGGVFHLWGHSWEIDQAGQWPAVERVLAMMGQAARQVPCLTNGELCNPTAPKRESARQNVKK